MYHDFASSCKDFQTYVLHIPAANQYIISGIHIGNNQMSMFIMWLPCYCDTFYTDYTDSGEGRMAEWLRYWTLSHEIVGLSPAIH